MSHFKFIKDLIKNSLYCSISTITKDGLPHSSPIGSVYVENEKQGYFIEMFTKGFVNQSGNKACILAVNTSLLFWLKSLIFGQFKTPPGVRLLVTLGDRREISDIERNRFHKRVRPFRKLKGHKLMWSNANYVRPFSIDKVIPVSIGKMTKHLES
ncbi:MAG: hypothetical protein BM556_01690 [Bacteriovorax sp. MedPE-SWde]|nr:MAG: hypothetical protein BM556_01690 [Bacteriovorax sp. MedPE-SWde]